MIDALAKAIADLDAAEENACRVRFSSLDEWMSAQLRLTAARIAREEAEKAAAWTREDA